MIRPPPTSTLFPYTTLFRSGSVPTNAAGVAEAMVTAQSRGNTTLTAASAGQIAVAAVRSEEHTSELQSHSDLVCRLLLEKKKKKNKGRNKNEQKNKSSSYW